MVDGTYRSPAARVGALAGALGGGGLSQHNQKRGVGKRGGRASTTEAVGGRWVMEVPTEGGRGRHAEALLWHGSVGGREVGELHGACDAISSHVSITTAS